MRGGKPVVLSYVELPRRAAQALGEHATLRRPGDPDLWEILPEVEVVLCETLNPDHLKRMGRLRLIQCIFAGVDALPWSEIPPQVTVCSNAGSNADAVSEHAWALILTLARNLHIHLPAMKSGVFDAGPGTSQLAGKTLAIVGMGAIGGRIAEIGKAFGLKVLGINRSGKTEAPCDFIGRPDALERVLAEGDVVVLTAPLNRQTRGMLDLRRLRLLKRDCILVNVGRAELIRREDLREFLRENPGFRFASDVWWSVGEGFGREAEFFTFPNVVGTPWVAGGPGDRRVLEWMVEQAAENVVRFLRGESPKNVVNRSDYVLG